MQESSYSEQRRATLGQESQSSAHIPWLVLEQGLVVVLELGAELEVGPEPELEPEQHKP